MSKRRVGRPRKVGRPKSKTQKKRRVGRPRKPARNYLYKLENGHLVYGHKIRRK